MTQPSSLSRLRALFFVLPLLALGCNGSSPTEPVEPVAQPKALTAAASTASDQAATTASEGEAVVEVSEVEGSVDDASVEGLRPGAARLGGARTAAAAVRQGVALAAAKPVTDTPTVAESRKPSGTPGGGNGNGGNGNGGNGNGNGNGGNGRGGELTFEIRPDVWNTNWEHAAGNVQAFVRGKDAAKIDTSSVQLVAESGDTLDPRSAKVAGGQLIATFAKDDAFDLLGDNVHSGDRVKLTLKFEVADGAKELTDQIRIVGPDPGDDGEDDGPGEQSLNISPDDWNTNWGHSAGMVHVFIRGDNLKDIDRDSIRLVGDKADAEPLEPLDVRLVGNGKQIVARFSKSAAYATLDDPDSGETHTVKIVYKIGDAAANTELSEDVHIVGP
ncbi:MAG TPA: hypothetical protein VGX68_30000 [Thermoanaerobaculia bacterium]|jgi:hypothetical protein|nr:hypothetical protein [Thermoanaerobaculia bacterium]